MRWRICSRESLELGCREVSCRCCELEPPLVVDPVFVLITSPRTDVRACRTTAALAPWIDTTCVDCGDSSPGWSNASTNALTLAKSGSGADTTRELLRVSTLMVICCTACSARRP